MFLNFQIAGGKASVGQRRKGRWRRGWPFRSARERVGEWLGSCQLLSCQWSGVELFTGSCAPQVLPVSRAASCRAQCLCEQASAPGHPLLPMKSQRSEVEHGQGLFRSRGAGVGEQGQ